MTLIGAFRMRRSPVEYDAYFDTVKDRLPKGFMRACEQNGYFHDAEIWGISIRNTGRRTSDLELTLLEESGRYCGLRYRGAQGTTLVRPIRAPGLHR